MRGDQLFIFTNLKTQDSLKDVIQFEITQSS
jgi:hypothetical protein